MSTRQSSRPVVCLFAACACVWLAATAAIDGPSSRTSGTAPRKNVLLIIIDDLRPEVAYYNESFMITPNIDRLGRSGLVFNRAFCQQAVCGATRNSFLSGRRPQRTQVWNFQNDFRQVPGGQDWITFPQWFKMHGYTTLGSGKTFHPGIPPNWDLPKSWSNYGVGCDQYTPPHTWNVSKHCQIAEPNSPTVTNRSYVFSTNGYPQCNQPEAHQLGWSNKSLVCPDRAPIESFGDTIDTQATLNDMEYATNLGKPFFVACGIHRPHLPWHMPRVFWDMYPPTEEIDLPKHQHSPIGMPPVAFTYECDGRTELCAFNETVPIPFPSGVINGSSGKPAGAGRGCIDGATCVPPPNITRSFRKGYYASVSFADHLVGMLLDKLEQLKQVDDTIVGLIGGGKHSNFELGTRVPMIIRAPHLRGGIVSSRLVESLDLYPTVAALAGLPPPPDLDGTDLTSLFTDPNSEVKPSVAFSEYPRCASPQTPWDDRSSCGSTPRENFDVMGLSVRVPEWRYTAWMRWNGTLLLPDFSKPAAAVELYAHGGDDESNFDMYENVNVASDPANAGVLVHLHAMAEAQWSHGSCLPLERPCLTNGKLTCCRVNSEVLASTDESKPPGSEATA